MNSGIHCFTSFTYAYLSRARVLARTLKKHNPDWTLWALITDREPSGFEIRVEDEDFDEIVFAEDLDVSDLESWVFKHSVVEICTAIKGVFLAELLDRGAEKVVYLDPDIAVFDSLDNIDRLLDDHEILLTPHQLSPETRKHAIVDNEICSLKHGTFNLGFLAVRNDEQGRACAQWWADRLSDFCYDDIPNGLFTDQKWCDLLPSFFPNHHIIRDPGCNVASWNLSQRKIEITTGGKILVNGESLKFYHFTKLGPVGQTMTTRYAGKNLAVYELWAWYENQVRGFEETDIPKKWWYYGRFDNGDPIPRDVQLLYRDRVDLRQAFPRPFSTGEGTFHEWLRVTGRLSPSVGAD